MVAVSVLIRTTGRIAALREALESLLKQTEKDFEVIVVEDGPATLTEFLLPYSSPDREEGMVIRYEALGARRGRGQAGNRALKLAQGDYCLFLDEDDALYPDHIRFLLQALRGAGCAIAHSWSEERKVERAADGSISRQGRFRRYRREHFCLLHLIASNFLPINAVLFSRSLFEKAGGFDEDLDCLEDWMLWLRYAAIEPIWLCVPKITAIYHAPFDTSGRRKAFRQWRPMVEARLKTVFPAWPMDVLRDDLRRHFGVALFLRRLYYHFSGYIRL